MLKSPNNSLLLCQRVANEAGVSYILSKNLLPKLNSIFFYYCVCVCVRVCTHVKVGGLGPWGQPGLYVS